jgi:hypothetical protein
MAAKPAYRAVKSGIQKAAPAGKEMLEQAFQSAQESGMLAGPMYAVPKGKKITAAPQDEALRTAQEKAVKMLGLPPGNTPMDRAKAMGYDTPDYIGVHQAPTSSYGAPLHELNQIYPDDIYSSMGARYYGDGADPARDAAVLNRMKALRGKPDAMVNVYRAVPKDAGDYINHGDWVTMDRQYAIDHGEAALGGKYKIIRTRTPAKTLFTEGNSLYELGLDKTQRFADAPSSMQTLVSKKAPFERSRFAAFDPSRIDENNLLAGLAALGIGLPAASSLAGKDEDYAKGGAVIMKEGGSLEQEFQMSKGGLLKKVVQVVKDVLPAPERKANLDRMLQTSKTPMRLYHGTTATEGGGQEAIRSFKPSKEGALGSGVYLTPNAGFGSSYAEKLGGNVLPVHAQIKNPLVIEGKGDPMVEALTKLGMDASKAERMVERAYDTKGYIGKEVESRARAAGYDGLMQYRNGELSEVVSYNPSAIKSAIGNEGTFDTTINDLSKKTGGAVIMKTGGKVKPDYKSAMEMMFHAMNNPSLKRA